MRRKSAEIVTRLVMIALLSAIGFILMSFVQIPYPMAPWLKIEISEVMTIIAYALYGFIGGTSVAIIKTGLNLLVHGPVGLGIGDMTALLTSFLYIFGIFLTSHIFKLFSKGFKFRLLAYVIISLLVSISLTILNGIFITPSYLTVYGDNPHLSTCFDDGVIMNVISYMTGNSDSTINGWTYIGCISSFYMPFNLLKSTLIFIVYEAIFNRLIFNVMSKSKTMNKYFIGSIFNDNKEKDDI